MTQNSDKYDDFAEHPRYGQRPHLTGLNPNALDRDVHLHWRALRHDEVVARYESATGQQWPYGPSGMETHGARRVPNTAVVADVARQVRRPVQVTHYFDVERQCADCDRWFIFFAQEQKHWYEELRFPLESDCVRCFECRQRERGIDRCRKEFESLSQLNQRTPQQCLDMADACLTLIEAGVFTARQTERVRMLFNSLPEEDDLRNRPTYKRLANRLQKIESGGLPLPP